ERLGGAAGHYGVGDPIGVTLPGVATPAGGALAVALLDDVRALVRRQPGVGRFAKSDASSGSEGARADVLVGIARGTAGQGAHLREIVTPERRLNEIVVGQRLRRALQRRPNRVDGIALRLARGALGLHAEAARLGFAVLAAKRRAPLLLQVAERSAGKSGPGS